MKNLTLIKNVNQLRIPTQKVKLSKGMEIGRDLLKFLKQYNKEHPSKPGVGLAANQLGINASVFVILQPQLVFINPKMVAHSHAIVRSTEGCLSLPGITVQVNRYIWIEMSADNWKQN